MVGVRWFDLLMDNLFAESLQVGLDESGEVMPTPNPYKHEIEMFEYTEDQLQPADDPQVREVGSYIIFYNAISNPLTYKSGVLSYLTLCNTS